MTPKYPRSPKSNFWSNFDFGGSAGAGVQLAKTGCSPFVTTVAQEVAAATIATDEETEKEAVTAVTIAREVAPQQQRWQRMRRRRRRQ